MRVIRRSRHLDALLAKWAKECDACGGSGGWEECPVCHGHGTVKGHKCIRCGEIGEIHCSVCGGTGDKERTDG